MKVISIINLKGGVGKSTTVSNLGYILWKYHHKKVLIVDNDKQGNVSKSFGLYDPDAEHTIAEIMYGKNISESVICPTEYDGIDIITSNMYLQKANISVMFDMSSQQQTKFQKFFDLQCISERYDYVIIDNAPDINISIINALTVSDEVVIPIQMDEYSFDGMDILLEQIEDNRLNFNPKLKLAGCLVTSYRNDDVNNAGLELLHRADIPTFQQKIRWTTSKARESTFAKMPLVRYSVRCAASQDYKKWVQEYLGGGLDGV